MTPQEADKQLIEALEAKLGRNLTLTEKEKVCAFPEGFK